MRLMLCIWILLVPAMGLASQPWDQIETCTNLGEAEQEVALSILKSRRPYDCCDETILECLSKEPVCPLVLRLAKSICRLAAEGRTKAQIDEEYSKRVASTTAPRVDMDLSGATPAGDPNAKIEIVAYLCARCPYCALFTRDIYKSVTSGRLKGKAKYYIRPYVLQQHRGSTAGALAMHAAESMGKFWEMFLYMCDHFNDFDRDKLPEWAALQGMDADRFRELMDDPAIINRQIESQKEAIRNGLDKTPFLFVNRREYTASSRPEALEDFVEGEYERLP
ncbi:MAG: thioredoxin domain-containing protein [Deltaproteobacteria bacterium]|nr:thioredoxin domain-containing protein [Deltaproteobacteria bacterium]